MWFRVEAVTADTMGDIPSSMTFEADVPAKPERVFEILSTAENQRDWFKDFARARWLGLRSEGVGAERIVELKLLRVKERFLIWEPGKRLAFTIFGATLPLIRRMTEDMVLEPKGEGTRLTWTVRYELRHPLMKVADPLLRRDFGGMFQSSLEGLARYAGR